jgi:hypothetical protein
MQGEIKLSEKQVKEVLESHFKSKGLDVAGVELKVSRRQLNFQDRHETPCFDSASIKVNLRHKGEEWL